MSALGAALRISRRDARRFRGRTALIMVMIGLPVLVFSGLLTTLAMVDVTPREDLPALLGAADARIVTQEGRPVEQDPTHIRSVGGEKSPGWTQAKVAALVHGRLLPCDLGSAQYRVGGSWHIGSAVEVDLRDPMTRGMRTMVEGRLPASPGEVAVSEGVRAQGVRLGDTIGVTKAERPVRVVGVYEHPTRPQLAELLGDRGVLLLDKSDGHGTGWLYAGSPVAWSQVRAMNRAGLLVQSRAVIEDPPAAATRTGAYAFGVITDVSWIALGTLAIVMETVLLAGPAFAVGLRRRRRELAMIAAQGGSARHLRAVVLADGLVLGGSAAVAATLLGTALPVLVFPLARLWFVPVGPVDVPWAAVLGVAALGLASGLVAALVPALQAGRQSPARVLAGRAAEARERAGRPRLGLLCVVAGLAVVTVGRLGRAWYVTGVRGVLGSMNRTDVVRLSVVAGGMLIVLGLVGVLPWLVRRSARLASGLPLPLRLAVRDAARHRSRTATAAAAVMAVTAAAFAFGLVVNGNQAVRERLAQHVVPMNSLQIVGHDLDDGGWAKVVAAVGQRLPGVRLAPGNDVVNARGDQVALQTPCLKQCGNGSYTGMLPVGDARLLAFLQGRQDARAAAALAAGQVVVFDPVLIRNGTVTMQVYPLEGGREEMTTLRMPAVRATAADPGLRGAVVPAGALASHGLKPVERRLYGMYVPRDLDQLQTDLSAVGDVYVATEEDGQDLLARTLWIALFAAMVLVLGGTFGATGLAAADLRGDLDTMTAVGAPPRVRRLVVAGQAAYIAGLGALVGVPAGGVVGVAVASISAPFPADVGGGFASVAVSVPWLFVAGLVLGLPLLAAVVAGAFTRTRWAPARRAG
jgi:putative ABC transport system permease protein